jgi:hypothetical protein
VVTCTTISDVTSYVMRHEVPTKGALAGLQETTGRLAAAPTWRGCAAAHLWANRGLFRRDRWRHADGRHASRQRLSIFSSLLRDLPYRPGDREAPHRMRCGCGRGDHPDLLTNGVKLLDLLIAQAVRICGIHGDLRWQANVGTPRRVGRWRQVRCRGRQRGGGLLSWREV